jgi:Asp-tRNA(Asn)/Glu-tRNA(Gln) amidotransferase C subunit
MAERRMFTQKIIDSDAFLDMPLSTQALYFHLNMRADDDGFVNNPKRIQRTIGASEDDLKLLIVKRFVIGFESGVLVIKHWRMHNTLRKDRYNPTQYQEELAMLEVKDNNAYTERATTWQPLGNHSATQYRLGKDSIGEVSIVEEKAEKKTRRKYGEYNNVLLSDEDMEKLQAEFPDWQERIERLSSYIASKGTSYKNHLATIRNWARKDKEQKPKRKEIVPKWCESSLDMDGMEQAAMSHRPVFKKTAADDEAIRAKAEALRKELSG